MFGGLGNLAGMLKQAQQFSGKLQGLAEELRRERTEGTAGGGMVTVEINGVQEVLACRIDPAAWEAQDREMLEDLVRAAMNDALARSKQLHAQAMQRMAAGMELPGMEEALAKLSGGPPTP